MQTSVAGTSGDSEMAMVELAHRFGLGLGEQARKR
jgi:hypothetical protein